MARVAVQLAFVWAEYTIDMVGKTADHLQQPGFTGGAKIGYPGFDHMPGTVKFMALRQIGPAPFRLLDGEICIEITIRLLGRGDKLDNIIRSGFQTLVWLLA